MKQTRLGNGLVNMRRRIEDMGGRFEMNSEPGRGCTVQLNLQWHRPARRAGNRTD